MLCVRSVRDANSFLFESVFLNPPLTIPEPINDREWVWTGGISSLLLEYMSMYNRPSSLPNCLGWKIMLVV